MPIEIKEIVIKANVEIKSQGVSTNSKEDNAKINTAMADMQLLVEQTFETIKHDTER